MRKWECGMRKWECGRKRHSVFGARLTARIEGGNGSGKSECGSRKGEKKSVGRIKIEGEKIHRRPYSKKQV
jgi:hypothetical protein